MGAAATRQGAQATEHGHEQNLDVSEMTGATISSIGWNLPPNLSVGSCWKTGITCSGYRPGQRRLCLTVQIICIILHMLCPMAL